MSSREREAELNNALLLYICQCQTSGDFKSLNDIGISPQVRDTLSLLTVKEVLHLCKMPSLFASIKIDNDLLQSLCQHVKQETHADNLLVELVKADAPLKLLKDLSGMSPAEFSALRKQLGICTLGRTIDPTPQQEMLVYEHWKQFGMKFNLAIEQWLEFSRITELPIRIIYKVIHDGDTGNAKVN